MIRNYLIGFFLLLFTPAFSQGNTPPVNQGDTIFVISKTFQTAFGKPFFNWTERPVSIDFKMYNRWGQLVAKSSEIDFRIDNAFLKKMKPEAGNTYFYQLKVILINGREQNYTLYTTYTGVYSGG